MADLKISALPTATTPLAGTEIVPVVQSSTTSNVTVANLTVGRDVVGLSFTGGNIKVSGNTLQAQNTNGSISVLPNGTGFTKVDLENYTNTAGQYTVNASTPQVTLAQLTLSAGTWLLTSNVNGVVASGLGTASSQVQYSINTSAAIASWNSTSGVSANAYYPQGANSFTSVGGQLSLLATISSSTTFYLYGGPTSISSSLQVALYGILNAVKVHE